MKYRKPTQFANIGRNEAIVEAVFAAGGRPPECLLAEPIGDDGDEDYLPEGEHKSNSSRPKEITFGAMRVHGETAVRNLCSAENTAALFAAQKYPAWCATACSRS